MPTTRRPRRGRIRDRRVPRVDRRRPRSAPPERTSKRLHRRIALGVWCPRVAASSSGSQRPLYAVDDSAANLADRAGQTHERPPRSSRQKYSEIGVRCSSRPGGVDRGPAHRCVDRDRLEGVLPPGSDGRSPARQSSQTISVGFGASPLAAYTQATAPLQGPKVAIGGARRHRSRAASVPDWIDGLSTLPDSPMLCRVRSPATQATGQYQVSVVIHVNEEAFSDRFEPHRRDRRRCRPDDCSHEGWRIRMNDGKRLWIIGATLVGGSSSWRWLVPRHLTTADGAADRQRAQTCLGLIAEHRDSRRISRA